MSNCCKCGQKFTKSSAWPSSLVSGTGYCIGWQRVELGDKNPTLFFEKPAVLVPTIDGTKIDDDIPF